MLSEAIDRERHEKETRGSFNSQRGQVAECLPVHFLGCAKLYLHKSTAQVGELV